MNPVSILVVEDEAIVAMNIEERLLAMGYGPIGRVASGEDALSHIQVKRPHLILMDIQLQGAMDGIETATEIRRHFHIPVIFLTAYSEDSTLDRAKVAEPFGYILKPFENRELKSTIEIALYKHQAEEEIRRLNQLHSVLSQVNQAIVRSQTRQQLLEAVCRLIVERAAIGFAWIGELDEASKRIMPLAQAGDQQQLLDNVEYYADERPEGQGNPGKAIRAGVPFICNECSSTTCALPYEKRPAHFGFQSCGSFPLRFRGRIFGSLNLAVAEAGFFQDKEISTLEEIAMDISFAMDKLDGDSKRTEIEEALKQSESRLRLALSASKMGVWERDFLNDRAFWSPECFEIAGMKGSEITAAAFERLLHPDDSLRVAQEIRKAIADKALFKSEYRILRSDSSLAWISDLAKADYDESGNPVRMVGIVRDITALKNSENALRHSETRYRKLFEEATEGIALANLENGHFLDCNRAFLQMTGYEKEELIGKPQAILHPRRQEDDGVVSRTFAQHRSSQEGATITESLITRLGDVRQVEIKANKLELGEERILQGFFRDVTDELRYHHERETTLKLLSLLNEPTDMHHLIRGLTEFIQKWTQCEAVGVRLCEGEDYPYFETRGFPSKFVEAERQLCSCDMNGQILRDSLGQPLLECMCGNILQGRFDPSLPFFTAKGSFWTNSTTKLLKSTTDGDRQGHTRNRCNTEGYESVALLALRHGNQTLGLLQINDMAEDRFTPDLIHFLENAADQVAIALAQRQTQSQLQASEERYRILVENAGEVVAVTQNGMLRFVNAQAEVVSGYSRSELMALPFLSLVHPDDRGLLEGTRQHASNRQGVLEEIVIRILRKDGDIRWLRIKSQTIEWNDTAATLDICSDITESRKAEEERERLKAQLFQAQKMESVGRLAGGIAHDFNNMLFVITGNADIVLQQTDASSPIYQDLQEIRSASQRSADLTRQLLAFARKQSVNPQVMDLNETIGSMTKMLLRLIGENIHLSWTPGNNLRKVKIDPSQIDQIIANLIVNARDAIHSNGNVSIETSNTLLDERYCSLHFGANPGEYVLLAISDTGEGMSTEVLDHIFEPFFTTKESGRGTGLGLATVYGIVQQNNGYIDVASAPGQGTTFKIYLPAVSEEAANKAQERESAQDLKSSETILVVEDETLVRKLSSRILRDCGYQVIEAANGADALKAAAEFKDVIHLVLTDMVMPGMDVRDMVSQLKKARPGIKELFISGYTEHMITDPTIPFLQKPFTIETLARKVREVLLQSKSGR